MIYSASVLLRGMAVLCFCLLSTAAVAQSWAIDDATEIVLPSGGTDPSHTITIEAPALSKNTIMKLPDSNSSGYLANDGSGNLSWSTLSSGITQVTNTNDSTTTSTSATQTGLRDFDVVPGAGSYLVLFNASVENT